MARFVMVGKYSPEAVRGITAERTQKVLATIKDSSGKVHEMYALLGSQDLLFIVDFPNIQQAMKASIALTQLTGIGFCTSPAVSVDDFDKLAG